MTAAYLLLEDGTRFDGESVGAQVLGTGEVVFNTSMSGYQEAVTDPSYAGQIIVFTYPLIGNYGVAQAHMESDRIHARAVIMREGVDREDAAHAEGGWLTWLADCGIPALSGCPESTRAHSCATSATRARCEAGCSPRTYRNPRLTTASSPSPPWQVPTLHAMSRRASP